MKSISFNRIITYSLYAILLVVLLLWNDATPPPMLLRIGFLLLLCLPVLFYSKGIFPFILIVFCTVSKFSPYPTYMPTEPVIYVVYVGLILLLSFRGLSMKSRIPSELVILAVYTVLVDIIAGGDITSVSYCLLTMFLLSFFLGVDKSEYTQVLPYGFVIASIVLSVVFLVSRDKFAILVDASQGIERVDWSDPNYFGFVIGMGTFCAINLLFQRQAIGFYAKLLLVATIIITSIVLVLNASRGALLSVLIVALILMLFSKAKPGHKIIAVLCGMGLIYFLYSGGYMELLMYRVTQGAGDGGGGRINIWNKKLYAFYHEANIGELLFGMGYHKGYNLGFGHGQGFHNDYLAFLVDYGLFGFILFVVPLFRLLISSFKANVSLFCTSVYLILCGMTIEPFTLGVFPYYLFFIYTIINVPRRGKGLISTY